MDHETIESRKVDPAEAVETLYERDFYSWTSEQARLVRASRFDLVDAGNLAEELETLGRSERASLESAFRLICLHQLKRLIQPERRSKSWAATIVRERLRAARVLRDNPGLRPQREALFRAAYADARREAAAETGKPLDEFPRQPPFSLSQMQDHDFWPETVPSSP